MAQEVVCSGRCNIRLACPAFVVIITCYRYQQHLTSENAEMADHLFRLRHNQRNWRFGLFFFFLRHVKAIAGATGLPYLPRAGIESAYQAAQTHRAREARATCCSGSQQPVLVDGFHARLIVGWAKFSVFQSD